MIQDTIFDCVNSGKSVLVYKEDVQKFMPDIANRWTALFVNEPTPPKSKLIDVINKLGHENKDKLKRKNIEELKEILESITRGKKIVIMFNHFEKMTQLAVDAWGFLLNLESIILVASYSKNFKAIAYPLYQKMEHIREEKHEVVDIKYSVFGILAALGLFSYMKLASLNVGLVAFGLLASIWFAFILFRTFIYTGR